jgi:hypothetical protein
VTGEKSILGSQQERVRTDVRLPPDLAKNVSLVCHKLGIPKNVFYTIAACHALVRLVPLLNAKKKNILSNELKSLVQKIEKNLA